MTFWLPSETEKEHEIYVNGMAHNGTLGEAFRLIYFEHISNLQRGAITPPHTIVITFNATQYQRIYHLMDILTACDQHTGILGALHYLVLNRAAVGSWLRRYCHGKLGEEKFNKKLMEAARD